MKEAVGSIQAKAIGKAFPSPCGEVVMKVMARNRVEVEITGFPSPCGEVVMKAVREETA